MSIATHQLAKRAMEVAEAAQQAVVALAEQVKLQDERIQKLEEKIRDPRRANQPNR